MKTDISLKLLTALRGADLLPLLGLPAASLVRVETRELPAGATRLDMLLRARSPQGQEYLHLVEWQGYYDPVVLWRLAGYVAWFGQQEPGTTVVGTVVYLAPEYDVGDTLTQTIDGQVVQAWPIRRIQLWTQDAQDALAANSLGLAVLSPLKDCLKRWFASVTRHAGCPDTPDSAPGVPASAGVWPEPAEAGTPAPGPYAHDKPFSDSF